MPDPNRRRLLRAAFAWPLLPALPVLPGLTGCAAPLGSGWMDSGTAQGRALLEDSAQAHGAAALAGLEDINVSYAGAWRRMVDTLQPELVDAGFRVGSQERLLMRQGLYAQAHVGPRGLKHVVRSQPPGTAGEVAVWFNGVPSDDAVRRAAAALVVDGYTLFLLGPMLLAWHPAPRALIVRRGGTERITVFGRPYVCDILQVQLAPGLGLSPGDRVVLLIDQARRLMRRVRFSLNGLQSTRGAVAEVDTDEHVLRHGVWWPTRFQERLRRPLPLPVHDWRLTGLDVNRGLHGADLEGSVFGGGAVVPAAAW